MDIGLWVIALLPPVSAIALCALLEFINKPTAQERKDRNAELIKARRAKINHNQQTKAGSK
jgi:hypothetical protein